ncbi:rhomboid family intramembrane serine protease [Nicoliella spurrieriana]|uniref:Rhomboid family intramembrane serine protease n=1 Tax=Nicoliella spurrieriana TaxID=2925830 RepID=A0A976RTH9_9LACO|nr:rhomboid family intramembrane serine protease [Nicoliella spurrieriana]UQS87521.1 rhomboid family intramembrane serine protease [Nicoliella spurrieriana]
MVAVFLIMTVDGGTSSVANLVRFGAKYNPLIIEGQLWRLVTPLFIHLSVTHILFNGITLYYMGTQLEALFGHGRFVLIFFISGIVGNLASFAFSDDISAGASTAIFGLFGAFMMIGETFWENPVVKQMTKTFVFFIILNLGFDLFASSIDIAGHIGGLVGGFLSAYFVGLPRKRFISLPKQILATITLVIIALALFYIGFVGKY